MRTSGTAGNLDGTPLASCVRHTTMVRLDTRQRAMLANKLADVTNLVTAAIVIGFAIGESRASWPVVGVTLALWAGFLTAAVIIARGK